MQTPQGAYENARSLKMAASFALAAGSFMHIMRLWLCCCQCFSASWLLLQTYFFIKNCACVHNLNLVYTSCVWPSVNNGGPVVRELQKAAILAKNRFQCGDRRRSHLLLTCFYRPLCPSHIHSSGVCTCKQQTGGRDTSQHPLLDLWICCPDAFVIHTSISLQWKHDIVQSWFTSYKQASV